MTPFRADCRNINHTYKQIYLADGSSILFNQIGVIDIHIKSQNREIGKLIITSLQTNAFVVEHNTSKTKSIYYANNNANNHMHIANKVVGHQKHKAKIDTNLLHDRFHRSDGVFATI